MPTPLNSNVFDNFSEYQVKILFNGWYTLTIWQFALSCTGLFFFAILYHLLRLGRAHLDHHLRVAQNRLSDKYVAEETARLMSQNIPTVVNIKGRESTVCGLYAGLFFMSIFQVGLWLFISMANMTFNPWVFLSILLGYSTGDVLFSTKIHRLNSQGSDLSF